MKTISAKLLGIIITILLIASCSQKPQEQVLGGWQGPKNVIYEFSEDGKLTLTRSGYGSQTASWAMAEDGKIIITYPGEGEHAVFVNEVVVSIDHAALRFRRFSA